MALIEIDHLHCEYEAQGRRYPALDDVSLRIEDGEFFCLIGPSGCGKTTLLRVLAGLQPPTAGQVRIGGVPLAGPGPERAVVSQGYTLFPWMTARKNVQFAVRQARRQLGRAEVREIADAFLQKVELGAAAEKYPYQLSGGMCQRVAIARALAMDTEILLLDEPFGALDARNRSELQGLLESLWENGGQRRKTVVFVTHDITEALRLADRVVFMRPGKVAAELPVDLPRPRDAAGPEAAARLSRLRKELMVLFYQNTPNAQEQRDAEMGERFESRQ